MDSSSITCLLPEEEIKTVTSHYTKGLLPDKSIEDLLIKVPVGRYERFGLKNLYLINSLESLHEGEGQIGCSIVSNHYKCNKCGKVFQQHSEFLIHQSIHISEMAPKHEYGKMFKQSPKCSEQQEISGENVQNICGKVFRKSSYLNRHERIQSGERAFKSEKYSHLIQHQRDHSGEKPYKCEECGKAFHTCSDLTQHTMIHTGEKPYKCEECVKAFHCYSKLIQHQRFHTGEKPYKCEDCSKDFSQYSSLIEHQRIHRGEKPYKCEEYDKAFQAPKRFAGHMTNCTGEKFYKCEECGKAFHTHKEFAGLKTIHTEEKPYQCQEKAFHSSQ
ncbi:zinc finger protein 678-like [Carlito syrichta]|uniref:Zinc finger protein 678-like n=1 Tax=Carlito syrichta TaxID=1868482 RepID=A0A3Q0DJ92_CARSF|nr:zinc finger protein 678-like [Carlito syrichta]